MIKFWIEAKSRIQLEHHEGAKTSELRSVDIILDFSPEQDPRNFLDAEGMPTINGVKAFTNAFCTGIVSNMRAAAEARMWARQNI